MPAKKNPKPEQHAADWRTTDELEIHRWVQRAIEEKHSVTTLSQRLVFGPRADCSA